LVRSNHLLTMLQDLRYAVRLLRRSPGFAATAIPTLALGIGVTSAIFSVVDGVLFRPVPFPHAERLVMVWETDRDSGTSHEPGAWPDFIDFQQRAARLDAIAGIIAGESTLTPERGDPVRLAGLIVTRDFLPLMGVAPVIGRTFTADDERLGGAAVVLISEALGSGCSNGTPACWAARFASTSVPTRSSVSFPPALISVSSKCSNPPITVEDSSIAMHAVQWTSGFPFSLTRSGWYATRTHC
jgi:hypothetical protein